MEVFETWDSVEHLRDAWDRLAEAVGADIYTTFDAARTWWRHYGRGELRIVVVRMGERLVGALPLFIERPFPLAPRVARLVGSDSTPVVLQPSVDPMCASAVLRLVLDALLTGARRCDAVIFSALGGDGPLVHSLRGVQAGAEGTWGLVSDRQIGVHTAFELPDDIEPYLASLDKRQRGNLRRDIKQIERQGELAIDALTSEPELRQHTGMFVSLHAEQWTSIGMLGHFGDWPGAGSYTNDLIAELAKKGRALLVRVHQNGTTLAYEWCLRLGQRCFWRLPARRTEPEWSRLGLGRIALFKLVETCISLDMKQIEAGPGHYDYKVRHGGREYPLCSFAFARATAPATVRTKLMLGVAATIHLLYYRVWRLKCAPRLGGARRPLLRLWIRTRL